MTAKEKKILEALNEHPSPSYLFVGNVEVYDEVSEYGRFYYDDDSYVIVAILPYIGANTFYVQ